MNITLQSTCDDPGAADDYRSMEGALRSHVNFLPKIQDTYHEARDLKMYQSSCMVQKRQ